MLYTINPVSRKTKNTLVWLHFTHSITGVDKNSSTDMPLPPTSNFFCGLKWAENASIPVFKGGVDD